MNRLFSVQNYNRVPDGTLVAAFLNSKDSTSGLPPDLLQDFSIAAGIIEPNTRSKIHIMPHVTQVTFVLQGALEIKMKDTDSKQPYCLSLTAQQSVITLPGTFFQLINTTAQACQVLYIVSPAYLYRIDNDGALIYDDSIVLEQDWHQLPAIDLEQQAQLRQTLDQAL